MAVEDGASLRRPGRTWVAAGASAAIVALAVTAGLRSSPMSLGPLIAVDSVSARVSGALLALGTAAPLGYALLAGMVASVNPCGFVLLPTYLAYYIGDRRDAASVRQVTGRAVAVSVTMTAGFVMLFGLLASGRALNFTLAPRAARRLRTATRNLGLGGYLAYGLAYALASLGCTLPVFLSVIGTSLQLHGLADAVGQFLLFGLGMGIVVTVLTVSTA